MHSIFLFIKKLLLTYTLHILRQQSTYLKSTVQCVSTHVHNCRGTRDQIATICWIMEKQEYSRKTTSTISASLTTLKPLTVWITTNCGKFKLWKRDGNIRPSCLPPEKPVCRSRRTVETGHGRVDWFKIGKGARQGCTLSPCLFNLYIEYIMRNVWLDEAQAGINIARRNINNLRYANNTPLRQKVKN